MPRRKPDDDDLKAREELAAEVKTFRKNNLFNQKKLAEILGLSRRTIQMIEAGLITPHPATLDAIRKLFHKHREAKKISI